MTTRSTTEVWHSRDARRLNDGYAHQRDEDGFCRNCGATVDEPHYKLVPRKEGLA